MKRAAYLLVGILLVIVLAGCGSVHSTGRTHTLHQIDNTYSLIAVPYRGATLYCIQRSDQTYGSYSSHSISCDYARFYHDNGYNR